MSHHNNTNDICNSNNFTQLSQIVYKATHRRGREGTRDITVMVGLGAVISGLGKNSHMGDVAISDMTAYCLEGRLRHGHVGYC